jgi:hypothetical protein
MRALLSLSLPLSLLACGGAGGKTGGGEGGGDDAAPTCGQAFRYLHPEDADPIDGLAVVGAFNGWDPGADLLTEVSPGVWEGEVDLPLGPHPYELVAILDWSVDDAEVRFCDPGAAFVHCEDGYKEPWDNGWQHTCAPGATSTCQSLVVVEDCAAPELALSAVDRSGAASGAVELRLALTAGASEITELDVTLDGEPVEVERHECTTLGQGTHRLLCEHVAAQGQALRPRPLGVEQRRS